MEDIKDKETAETDEGKNTNEDKVEPCSASRYDRQSSFKKNETIEQDFPSMSLKNDERGEISCIQEAEGDLEKKMHDKDRENVASKDIPSEHNASDISSSRTAEEEDDIDAEKNVMKMQKTVDFEDSSKGQPDIDIKGCKTVDEDEPGGNGRVVNVNEQRPRRDTLTNTKIIFKVSKVMSHPKNKDSSSMMIKSLPSELVKKLLSQLTIIGRGEGVDVYLHDMLSSRRHGQLNIAKDRRGFVVQLTNISDTKVIKLNGNRNISPQQTVELATNDQLTIGCFTFLLEIVLGDSESTQYELKFNDICSNDVKITQPSESHAIYPQPPGNAQLPRQPVYGYGQPRAAMYNPDQGPQLQGQYRHYMPVIPPVYAQDPYAPFQMQRMQYENELRARQMQPAPQMAPQMLPPQRQQASYDQLQQLNQQMANMNVYQQPIPQEHDERYGMQAMEGSERFDIT
eukprot:gene9177-10151_t